MCTSDITPYLQMYDNKTKSGVTPDFNTQHKCRNFDKIHEWAEKNKARPETDWGFHGTLPEHER